MLKIAICDDEKVFRDNINKYVAAYLNEKEILIKLVDCLEKCLICRHIRRFAD